MWQETPLKVCGNFKMTISFLAYSKEVPEDCSIVFFRCIWGHFSMQFWWQKWVPSPLSHSFRSLQWTLSPRPACSDNHHYWNWKKIVKIFFYILYMHYLTSVRSRRLDIKEVLFCVFIDEDAVEVDKNAKKNEANVQPCWSIRDLLYGQKENFLLRNQRGKSRAHLARSGSESERRIRFILPSRGFSYIKIAFIEQ